MLSLPPREPKEDRRRHMLDLVETYRRAADEIASGGCGSVQLNRNNKSFCEPHH
jgi:hypothetical protein